jgi:hypothetical protein
MDNNLASYEMMKYYRFIFLLSKNDDDPQFWLSNLDPWSAFKQFSYAIW